MFTCWVKSILRSAYLSLLINGKVVGFFQCSRSVRQGDPLSPLLFILAEEALNQAIHSMISQGCIKGVSAPRRCAPPSHVFYAYDLIIFCSAFCLQCEVYYGSPGGVQIYFWSNG